ncbi:hypothetical protein [Lentzea sp. NBRC 105346]|uniref:hypothetical protein n=1 Tax=Lentzea sp. NBRC 105346 TaxID=3032205 RepID=UPI002557B3DE|nr:hypothetical protein [Lentzea sp. NBRC 105346]
MAAATFAAGCSSGSSADVPAPVDIQMTPSSGVRVSESNGDTHWSAHGAFDFTVRVTDKDDENAHGLTVFVSLPHGNEVTGSGGDHWTCKDVDGGIDCHIDDMVVPGEAWPVLNVSVRPERYSANETIDVHAKTGGFGAAHEGVHYHLDTGI